MEEQIKTPSAELVPALLPSEKAGMQKSYKYAIIIGIVLVLVIAGFYIYTNMAKKNSEPKLTGEIGSSIETAVFETSKGTIEIELNREKAPITVENFVRYVNDHFYDGTVFHRVIAGFMVQGGGFTADGKEKQTRDPIKIESNNGLKNDELTVAMARTADPNSATSQFFINTVNNTFLNYGFRDEGYAVFGKVVSGMDIVKSIEAVKTKAGDWPVENVIITKAYIKKSY